MLKNVVIYIFVFIENLLRFLECEMIMFDLFLGILNELFIFHILLLDLNVKY